MPSDDWWKSSFRESSESLVNSTSGGCPVGVRCPAKYKRAPRARTTAPIATTQLSRFVTPRPHYGITLANSPAVICGNTITPRTTIADMRNRRMLTGLRR